MARTGSVRITRPAQLGLVALTFIVIAALGIYFVEKFVRGTGGYQMAVHFRQAAGIASGSQVLLNGVVIGGVTKVKILPDTTVDAIINVFRDTGIPKNAKFAVQTTLTGTPSVSISVPAQAQTELWPKRILPVAEQPIGTPPLTLETFMAQSRGLGDRASDILAQARPYGKRLVYHLQNSRSNGTAIAAQMRSTRPQLMAGLQSTIAQAKANVQSAQTALREHNQAKIAAIAQSFDETTAHMKAASDSLSSIRRDPQVRDNLQAATAQLRELETNMAGLSHDMQMIAGNPQTKAQLRDASARLRALLHKI